MVKLKERGRASQRCPLSFEGENIMRKFLLSLLCAALLTPALMAETQYTLETAYGPAGTAPTFIDINNTKFTSLSIYHKGTNSQQMVFAPYTPGTILGLAQFTTGPLASGDYDSGASFGPGGSVIITGRAADPYTDLIRLDGAFVSATWKRQGNFYELSGKITGTLQIHGAPVCSGNMAVEGRTINTSGPWSQVSGYGRWLQYVTVSAKCR